MKAYLIGGGSIVVAAALMFAADVARVAEYYLGAFGLVVAALVVGTAGLVIAGIIKVAE